MQGAGQQWCSFSGKAKTVLRHKVGEQVLLEASLLEHLGGRGIGVARPSLLLKPLALLILGLCPP